MFHVKHGLVGEEIRSCGGDVLYWVIGIISVLGVLAGIYNFLKKNKANGIMEILVAVICPIITIWFCSMKVKRCYSGTDLEFMVQSTIEGDIYPLAVLILLIVEVILVAKTFIKLEKSR